MSYEVMKRHGGTLNALLLNERSQSEEARYSMSPTISHSGKGTTIESVKLVVGVKGTQRILRSVELLCLVLKSWTHVIIKTHTKYNIKSKP